MQAQALHWACDRAHLGVVDECAQVANDAACSLLGVTRPVSEPSANNGRDESQACGIHSVDERRVE